MSKCGYCPPLPSVRIEMNDCLLHKDILTPARELAPGSSMCGIPNDPTACPTSRGSADRVSFVSDRTFQDRQSQVIAESLGDARPKKAIQPYSPLSQPMRSSSSFRNRSETNEKEPMSYNESGVSELASWRGSCASTRRDRAEVRPEGRRQPPRSRKPSQLGAVTLLTRLRVVLF